MRLVSERFFRRGGAILGPCGWLSFLQIIR
jgi:hypothetical protein